jgi:hypothetical protein
MASQALDDLAPRRIDLSIQLRNPLDLLALLQLRLQCRNLAGDGLAAQLAERRACGLVVVG